jgi:TP901 family phage tail tape measure protein
MASDVFDLFARLSIDISDYSSGLNKAKGMAGKMGGAITSGIGKAAKLATAALAATSTAVTAFTKGAVQTGLSFDAAMGQVAATAGKSAEELAETTGHVNTAYGEFNGTLRDFAKFMGKNTAFTATEAAQALNYMALAGYNTQQSMEMLPIVLDMAAAGSMDLARASDMITDTQSALGLSSERTALMVDEFAKAASTGNTSVEQLGEAFLTVGGLGKELNSGFVQLSDGTAAEIDNIEQLEIAFTAMANAGIKGSEAGTHMRNMLLKLSNPTKQGAEALEAMGITIFDAEGRMKSLDTVFSQLGDKFKQMTQQEKLSVIGDLFNARDTASAEALLAAVEQDWDRIGESILQAKGSATQMAETKLDNLQGQLTKMKSALEGAKIALSDKIVPSLKNLAGWATKAISDLTTSFEEGGVGGLMDKFGELLSEGLNKAIEKLPALSGIARNLLSTLGRGLLDNMDVVAEAATQVLTDIFGIVLDSAPGVFTFIGEFFKKIGTWVTENTDMILTGIENLVNIIVDFIANNAGTFVSGIVQLITKITQKWPDIIKSLLKALPKIIKDITKALIDNLPLLIAALVQLVTELVPYLPEVLSAIVVALPQVLTAVFNAIVDSLPQLIAAVWDLIKGLVAHLPEMLGAILEAVWEVFKGIVNLFVPFGELWTGAVEGIGTTFKEVFEGFDLLGFVGGVLEEVVGIAKGIFDFFGTLMDDPAQAIKDAISGILSYAQNVFQSIKQIIMGIFDLIEAEEEAKEAEDRAEWMKGHRERLMATGNYYTPEEMEQMRKDDEFVKSLNKTSEVDIKVGGTITHEGVNSEGELIGSVDSTMDALTDELIKDSRLGYGG